MFEIKNIKKEVVSNVLEADSGIRFWITSEKKRFLFAQATPTLQTLLQLFEHVLLYCSKCFSGLFLVWQEHKEFLITVKSKVVCHQQKRKKGFSLELWER